MEDFRSNFKVPFEQYLKRYFIGHYNPNGNHFFAYAIKGTVMEWLEPKPITYPQGNQRFDQFDAYLQSRPPAFVGRATG